MRSSAAGAMALLLTAVGAGAWTDENPQPGQTQVRAAHLAEIGTAVNAKLGSCGFAPVAAPSPAPGAPLRAADFNAARSAVRGLYSAFGRGVPTFSDGDPLPAGAPVRLAHLTELRADVDASALWPCPCTSNGSCDAPAPACEATTTGHDNCGSFCSKTGPACPPPVCEGCSAPEPACGSVTTGADSCGAACSRTGPACVVCSGCSAAEPACGQTTSGVDSCGAACARTGSACPPPECTGCSAGTPACGQTTTGVDSCGRSCSRTGPDCPACVASSCDASPPACGQTTSGSDNCGNSCTKTGPSCPIECTGCSAPEPACGQTSSGQDSCGNSCSKSGPDCPPPDCRCPDVGAAACGQPVSDNCGNSCGYGLRCDSVEAGVPTQCCSNGPWSFCYGPPAPDMPGMLCD